MSKPVARLALPAIVALALAGCGSSNSSTTATTATSGSSSGNPTVVALVPASAKSKGTLIVAADASYPPNEFVSSDGHTVIGMDADLAQALAKEMGLSQNTVNATFATIIPGITSGKYDVGASSFTDTKEREKTVTFVTYFSAGTSFYAKSSSNPGVNTLADLCGKTVAVEKGTTQQEDATKQSATCTKEGKKGVTVLVFADQNSANLAISSGRAEIGMADSPVAAYQVKQSNGQFKLVGQTYGTAPYGIAIAKSSGLAPAIQAALKAMIANGTYQHILEKWGVQSGAITTPVINGATS